MTLRQQKYLTVAAVIILVAAMAAVQMPRIRTNAPIRNLSAQDSNARGRALEYLKGSGGDRAVRKLAEKVMAARPSTVASERVVEILKARGPAAVRLFILALAEDSRDVNVFGRQNITVTLRAAIRVMPDEAGEEVARFADHPNDDVREVVAEVLGEVDRVRAEPLLLKLLKDARTRVRLKAMASLGRQKSAAVVAPLLWVLENDRNGACRAAAADALGRIGDPATAEALAAALHDRYAATNAIRALARLDKGAGLDALAELLQSWPEWARLRAVEALPADTDERAFELLVSAADDESARVREEVAKLFGRLEGRSVFDPLVKMLADKSPIVRRAAVLSLKRLRDENAVEPLIALLDDEDQAVRLYAATALWKLGGESQAARLIRAVSDGRVPVTANIVAAFCRFDDPQGAALLAELSRPGTPTAVRTMRAVNDAARLIRDGHYVLTRVVRLQSHKDAIEGGAEQSLARLLHVLYHGGTLAMAEDFYWSGNHSLRTAARLWALSKGLYGKLAASEDSPERPKWGQAGGD